MLTATKTSSIDTATNTNWQVDPAIKTNKQIKTTKPKLIDRWIQQITKTTLKKDRYNNQIKSGRWIQEPKQVRNMNTQINKYKNTIKYNYSTPTNHTPANTAHVTGAWKWTQLIHARWSVKRVIFLIVGFKLILERKG